ncbi:synaptogyrin-1-like [Sycon ciliatum]|uniref:synaptogyrin-1-like n=1 Tax=Sycon ciliatum TaxID=27933 RepID=UPI0031F70030
MAEKEAGTTGQQTSSTEHTVTMTFCCLPIPCCFGVSGIDANKLKLVGAICTGLTMLFSIIVVGVINNELHIRQNRGDSFCFFNANNSNCGYGVFCGGFSIFLCIVFGALYFLRFKPVVTHEFLGTSAQYLFEAIAAGVMAMFFLISALVLANADRIITNHFNKGSAANAVVTFSFFAAFTWSVMAYIPFTHYKMLREGASSGSGNNSNPNNPV